MYNMGEMSEIMSLQWASVDNSRVNGEIWLKLIVIFNISNYSTIMSLKNIDCIWYN